jgi:hypothetical protein
MALQIELSPEAELRLRKAAAAEGTDPAEYARLLIERHLPTDDVNQQSLWRTLPAEEWKRAAREFIESHDRSVPLLPDEAVSRESFYEGRP